MAKISKEKWVVKGFKLLQKEGYNAIKLDNICEKFNVTSGSFYHHFTGMNEYITEILRYWEKETIGKFSEMTNKKLSAAEKRKLLIAFTYNISGTAEISFRAWALHNKIVRRFVNRFDDLRIKIAADIYKEHGLPAGRAYEIAEFANASWLGILEYCVYNPDKKQHLSGFLGNIVNRLLKVS